MKRTHAHRRRGAIALVAGLALIAAACGDDDDDDAAESAPAAESSAAAEDSASAADTASAAETIPAEASAPADSGEPVTIEWWHIQNNDPGKSDWQAMADAYTADHPNVTIKITVMENEAFKAAIQTNVQAGDVPDLFQSWGGGVLRDQVAAGAVQDITDAAAPYVDALSPGVSGFFNVDDKLYG